MHLEGDFSRSGFEPVPGYRNAADSPFQVVPQTSGVLDLSLNGLHIDRGYARRFLEEATSPYLARAKEGLEIISSVHKESIFINWQELVERGVEMEDREKMEAFGYMNVIFGFMPELPSSILPKGYSRRGNLRPPETKSQYYERVRELRLNVYGISNGKFTAGIPVEFMSPPLTRTLAFFRTGSWLPFKFPDAHKDRAEFEKLLGSVEINLGN